ncbi:endonuclease MutS2 [Pediococcus ethanolidurans]|uniref:Endonuclease MutS2 n=1 Tax=Pediococcus ethanolidurans TaxID=319653 RepID=A0A0R2K280_9LACO|nr:endonuclease MutS2 [Pediococcus ethanolidurans]KRN81942.1 mutS protein [Pediococcus ethanolidurans]GEN95527.1 endonuclease MutS2 [Pediococcus ethanolidurans]SER78892.1 DNA mismatch repair protein MutS2 [Pediococcus ethanolidurans]
MNKKIFETLEYQKVKDKLKPYLASQSGRQELTNLTPMVAHEQIQFALTETLDGADAYRLKGGIPIAKLDNIGPQMKRLEIGATLSGLELSQVTKMLRSTQDVINFFQKLQEEKIEFHTLYDTVKKLQALPEISKRLIKSIEGDGHITSEASDKLFGIRSRITTTETSIRAKMDSYTRGKDAKYLSESIITMRDGRYVIPVMAQYRSHFGGVVHDQSASGQTMYIEPAAVMDLNNQLRQNQVEEKNEEERILAELSELLAPYREDLLNNAAVLGHLDFINAKARYAAEIKGTEPTISAENHVHFRNARHPLIDPKKIVPNDIDLGTDYKALIITGPNTGGKTITLKTFGLLQLMAQSGLFIPVAEHSQMGIFTEIFADIGDEQSIEQNLSTFSSHMDNIVQILAQIDEHSLVLFDELGGGTDPKEGAALAIAILDRVGSAGSYVLATTHYPELKAYGYNRPETMNASMEFDTESLKPTYKLLVGIPGSSNAFDIAKRLGLESGVIMQARSLMDQDSQDLSAMIKDLSTRQKEAADRADKLKIEVAESETLHKDLTNEYQKLLNSKDQYLEKAKQQANDLVDNAEEKADKIIKKLRKMEMQGGAGIKENQLINSKSGLNALHQAPSLKKNRVLRRVKAKQELKVNDDVMVTSYGQRGSLLRQMDKKHWEVQMGILKMKVPTDELEKIAPDKNESAGNRTTIRRTSSAVKTTLDLRGKRYEEAMTEVDRYIDSALLAGYPMVTIVHGKGTGALRKGITQYLQGNRQVKHFEYAAPNVGGNGATVVHFK